GPCLAYGTCGPGAAAARSPTGTTAIGAGQPRRAISSTDQSLLQPARGEPLSPESPGRESTSREPARPESADRESTSREPARPESADREPTGSELFRAAPRACRRATESPCAESSGGAFGTAFARLAR